MSSCPGTRDLGQLTKETVPLPDFGGMYERCVRYSGLGGRADQTRVDLTLPALGTTYFEDALSYTNRGLIDTQQFPESWSCPPGGPCGFLPAGGSHFDYDRGVMTGSTFGGTSSVASSLVEKWAPNGAPTRVLFGNGVRRVVELDELERPARISVEDAVGAMLWDSGLTTYDGLGNILAIGMDAAVPGTHPQAFTYDAQMRLASASLTLPTTLSVTDVQYSYDGFGNMTDRVGTPWPGPTEGGFTARAHFDATTLGHDNRVHDAGWNYDPSGNLVSEPGGRQYSWDTQGRMRSLSQGALSLGSYAYDAGGERLLRQDASGLTFTYRGGAAGVLAEYVWDASLSRWRLTREYASGVEGEHQIDRDPSGAALATYFGRDHLGTPRVLMNDVGAVQSLHLYEPFGIEAPSGMGADDHSHRFTGHERDVETGLDYMHARYYGASTSRLLSPDPVTQPRRAIGHPLAWNRYAYVDNTPVRLTDRDGMVPKSGIKLLWQRTKHWFARHVKKDGFPAKSKFKTNEAKEVRKLAEKTRQVPDSVTPMGNRVVYEKEFNKEVGTEGEKVVRVVTEPQNGNTEKVITTFPTKDFMTTVAEFIPVIGGFLLTVDAATAVAEAGATAVEEAASQGAPGQYRRELEAAAAQTETE